ncbi:hypothetical protein NSK_002433 [Nannochloropsis salina CCMP1776]|uniref:RING-type E3 ubiquitin transferase (cysteine targeting) n=1 Tax=Nannochloropsis salina CCMP1776 TaxID=1027361 RepID=A0A4D9D9T6_9STRA|nr:hypothetical protein NSK_002433 [Nannochloropsis salina CCMP1776]|eukprot:TFJ86225.1 hypothetical protein NSK_002433 [Nannochloropsis salina CCMP1776]
MRTGVVMVDTPTTTPTSSLPSSPPSSSQQTSPALLSPSPPPSAPRPENTIVIPADPLQTPLSLYSEHRPGASVESARGKPGGGWGLDTASSGVMKVNQVDARVLDTELLDLLQIQLCSMFAPPFFAPGVVDKYKPELKALLDFLLFRFTIFQNEPTPGMRMQNLRFVDGHAIGTSVSSVASSVDAHAPRVSQRLLLGFLCIAGQWSFARLRRHALVAGWADEVQHPQSLIPHTSDAQASNGDDRGQGERSSGTQGGGQWKRRAYRALTRAESLFRLAWLLNFLVFLRVGSYPSLLQRLVGMRLVYGPSSGGAARNINFQFMNRQLLWEHFTQLALCVVPLVDWDGLRRQVSGLIRQRRAGAWAAGAGDGGGSSPGGGGGGRGYGVCCLRGGECADPLCDRLWAYLLLLLFEDGMSAG